jgi:hypothetical protein
MIRLNKTWTVAAFAAVVLGITFSLLLGGAFGPAAATGAAPAATPNATPAAIDASQITGCRSSVARVVLAGTTVAEPAVANNTSAALTNCQDDTTLVQKTALLGTPTVNFGQVGPAGADTFETGALNGNPLGATAVTDVNAASLTFGGYTLSVAGPLEAQAVAGCAKTGSDTYATSPYLDGTADLDAITITGPGLPAAGETLEIGQYVNDIVGNLPAALGALITIKANEQITAPAGSSPNTITERLLDITLLGSGAQVVVGEAQAALPNNGVCATNVPPNTTPTPPVTVPGTTTTVTGTNGTVTTVTTGGTGPGTTTIVPGGTVPSYLQECPTGSTLDPTSGDCVIFYQGQTIYVSKPFKGPTGGTVVPLAAAQAKFKSSCLAGAGPNYVLLVTALNAVAKGTPSSDRILGLNTGQHISGLAGDDCIDEQSANGKVVDGNGKDRIYVTSGSNRVVAGNGPNTIHGGNGKNWITDGTGDDYIYGGSLANRIDAYGNEKHIYGGKSNDRIWTNSIRAFVSCGGGNANILFGREKIIAYGKKHGCQKLGRLK